MNEQDRRDLILDWGYDRLIAHMRSIDRLELDPSETRYQEKAAASTRDATL